MNPTLLDVLACPKCGGSLVSKPTDVGAGGDVREGTLDCSGCAQSFPIRNGIPRFVPVDNYASSFGLQWNTFKREQLDSFTKTRLSADRFFTETTWSPDWMRGKWIADIGCGAGRFLEIAAGTGANVVGVDVSSAIDAAASNLAGRPNAHFVQASAYELPFKPGVFDGVYCIGVLQHTPDPLAATRSLPRPLKSGGRLVLTIYERKRFTKLNAKYLVRPITKRLPKRFLLAALQATLPIVFPITELLFRIPVLGRFIRFAVPVANYVEVSELSLAQRYRWAVLDTFDMLSPSFDQPLTFAEAQSALRDTGVGDLKRGPGAGLNVIGRKA